MEGRIVTNQTAQELQGVFFDADTFFNFVQDINEFYFLFFLFILFPNSTVEFLTLSPGNKIQRHNVTIVNITKEHKRTQNQVLQLSM